MAAGLWMSGCSASSLADAPSDNINPFGGELPRLSSSSTACKLSSGASVLAAGRLRVGQSEDVVVGSSTTNELSVLSFTSAVECVAAKTYPLSAVPSALAVGDLDGDANGNADVVVGSASDNQISVLLTNSDGTLKARVPYTFPGPTALAIGDVDGKLGSDVVVLGSTNNSVQILLNQGSGNLTLLPTEFVGGRLLYSLSLMQMSATRTDLILVSPLDDRLDILSSQGSNQWTSKQTLPTSGLMAPVAVQVGKLDDNIYPDFVVVGNNSNSIAIYLQDAPGHFVADVLEVGDGPVAVAIADLNGDMLPDLAVLEAGDESLRFILQVKDKYSPQRAFATSQNLKVPVGHLPVAVVAADLQGDGRPELVVADKEDPMLRIISTRGVQ